MEASPAFSSLLNEVYNVVLSSPKVFVQEHPTDYSPYFFFEFVCENELVNEFEIIGFKKNFFARSVK